MAGHQGCGGRAQQAGPSRHLPGQGAPSACSGCRALPLSGARRGVVSGKHTPPSLREPWRRRCTGNVGPTAGGPSRVALLLHVICYPHHTLPFCQRDREPLNTGHARSRRPGRVGSRAACWTPAVTRAGPWSTHGRGQRGLAGEGGRQGNGPRRCPPSRRGHVTWEGRLGPQMAQRSLISRPCGGERIPAYRSPRRRRLGSCERGTGEPLSPRGDLGQIAGHRWL